jgi:hypothetical protein
VGNIPCTLLAPSRELIGSMIKESRTVSDPLPISSQPVEPGHVLEYALAGYEPCRASQLVFGKQGVTCAGQYMNMLHPELLRQIS